MTVGTLQSFFLESTLTHCFPPRNTAKLSLGRSPEYFCYSSWPCPLISPIIDLLFFWLCLLWAVERWHFITWAAHGAVFPPTTCAASVFCSFIGFPLCLIDIPEPVCRLCPGRKEDWNAADSGLACQRFLTIGQLIYASCCFRSRQGSCQQGRPRWAGAAWSGKHRSKLPKPRPRLPPVRRQPEFAYNPGRRRRP